MPRNTGGWSEVESCNYYRAGKSTGVQIKIIFIVGVVVVRQDDQLVPRHGGMIGCQRTPGFSLRKAEEDGGEGPLGIGARADRLCLPTYLPIHSLHPVVVGDLPVDWRAPGNGFTGLRFRRAHGQVHAGCKSAASFAISYQY